MPADLLDVNVLIALVVEEHVHHDLAEAWLAEGGQPFATCAITQAGLVRFLMREGASSRDAFGVLAAVTGVDRHVFWADDLPVEEVAFDGVVGHRQVTDAYLAGLARHRGERVATLDRGLLALAPDVTVLVEG